MPYPPCCHLVVIAALATLVAADLCPSMDIRNDISNLRKLDNCTVIVGRLMIVLLDEPSSKPFERYSFPKLTEITEYLVLFDISGLTSLRTLFPNLRVVRGVKLFRNCAIVMWRLTDIKEIGLHNLRMIGRGDVRIDHCPKLCFADTINWNIIGKNTDLVYYKSSNAESCDTCPVECSGYCWNSYTCQKLKPSLCDPECVDCSQPNSSRHCLSCKNFEDHGSCVRTCSSDLYSAPDVMRCVTKTECETMLNGTFWVFNNNNNISNNNMYLNSRFYKNTCIRECPMGYEPDSVGRCRSCKNCYKWCPGTMVETIQDMESLNGCTHINGSLEVRIHKGIPEWQLRNFMEQILEIRGLLKIARTDSIQSLDFLRNLRVIGGETLENKRYALTVYENQNLQRLFNFSSDHRLTIENGLISFHNNHQLCYVEIEKLGNLTGKLDSADVRVFQYTNGDRSSCNQRLMEIKVETVYPTSVTVSWEDPNFNSNETIIGYAFYYRKVIDRDVTTFDSDAVCDVTGWTSAFVSDNNITILQLDAYSRYGFYIKTYFTGILGYESPIHYFTTLQDDPPTPWDFIASALNDTTLNLKWYLDADSYGKLSYFEILVCLEEDELEVISQRNYCTHPHVEGGSHEDLLDKERDEQIRNRTEPTCSCDPYQEETINFFHTDILELCSGKSKGRCKKVMYHVDPFLSQEKKKKKPQHNFVDAVEKEYMEASSVPPNFQEKRAAKEASLNCRIHNLTNVSATTHQLGGLQHYRLYILFFTACNEKIGNQSYCSAVLMTSQRTKPNPKANQILEVTVEVLERNALVRWSEPKRPNSLLVSYHIELRRMDIEHSKAGTDCITYSEHVAAGFAYEMKNLSPGRYAIKVQAASVGGPGEYSTEEWFEIEAANRSFYWLYITIGVVGVVLLIGIVFLANHCYKTSASLDNMHLIASINPDYAGQVYVPDEWEVERNDIEIIAEIGQGSFGMVHEGLIRSRRQRCAVKTVNDNASLADRQEFLYEGSVMKSFNDGYHVVKLLGIVSSGQPPYVIMELMERGDLKHYLRRCREPSQNLTSSEMYRMAGEIADGMAYLGSKKFVHRDLAARNCMVSADRTVKIGDFGMARDIYETDYYRKETVGLLPVRWMAPESLIDGVFTCDSDVWSYGVVLWEMATLAEQPYQGLSNDEVFNFVKTKGKLPRPQHCSDDFFKVMVACWEWRPNSRPMFAHIVEELIRYVGPDFQVVSWFCSPQGVEYRRQNAARVYNAPAMPSNVVVEDDYYGRYDPKEEAVGLYMRDTQQPDDRPWKVFPFANQRFNPTPYQQDADSPTGSYSLDSS